MVVFSELVVTYMFFGGTAAGACCVCCFLALSFARQGENLWARGEACVAHRRFFGFGFLIAAAVGLVGALCLLADMRRPEEVLTLLLSPSFSVSSVGAYALASLILTTAILGLMWLSSIRVPRMVTNGVYVLGITLSVVTMTYTALLLMAFPGSPLFRSAWLIPLFMLSSLSCGCSLVVLLALVTRTWESMEHVLMRMRVLDVVLIVLEVIALLAFILMAGDIAPESAASLLIGEHALAFWLGVVTAGLCVPLVLMVVPRRLVGFWNCPAPSAVFVLVGGFALRWCILKAA